MHLQGEHMVASMIVRDEVPEDIGSIFEVTAKAFATLDISDKREPYVIEALRHAGALSLSLVAVFDGRVIGHVAFSPVAVSDGTEGWFGLGPLSVHPAYPRRGVGTALVREGLARLQSLGAAGCCLVGHPTYYVRFGFMNAPGLNVEGVPPEYFFAMPFKGEVPKGVVTFHEALKV